MATWGNYSWNSTNSTTSYYTIPTSGFQPQQVRWDYRPPPKPPKPKTAVQRLSEKVEAYCLLARTV